jgi:hypothetical protein
VALLQVLLPEGERRYLRDCGITMLPLAQLNAVLAPLGYVLVGTKTRAAERFVLCTDVHGEIERYGRFALRRIEKEMCDAYMDVGVRPHHGVWAPAECHARRGTVADALVLWLRCRGSRGALCLTLWLPRGGPAGHHPTAPRVCATRAGVCPPTGRGTRLVVL